MTKSKTQGVVERVANQIITKLEAGNLPPWSSGRNELVNRPSNVVRKTLYKGLNSFILSYSEYETPLWGTFANWKEMGTYIRKDEKSTLVIAWSRKVTVKDVLNKKGETEEKTYVRWVPFQHNIFNIHQTAMTPEQIATLLPDVTPTSDEKYPEGLEVANSYLENSGVKFAHKNCTPCYIPSKDMINMPKSEVYFSQDAYVSTLFHEMGHSTGATSRLDRDFSGGFGSEKYSFEELVAEMTAASLCSVTKVVNSRNLDNSAAYIKSWLEVLQNDIGMISKAASQAQKAVDLILGNV